MHADFQPELRRPIETAMIIKHLNWLTYSTVL